MEGVVGKVSCDKQIPELKSESIQYNYWYTMVYVQLKLVVVPLWPTWILLLVAARVVPGLHVASPPSLVESQSLRSSCQASWHQVLFALPAISHRNI